MRFDGKGNKINRKVDYPTQLSVPEYRHDKQHKETRSEAIYNLSAVIVHEGNQISSGHYICYVKRNGRWFYTSDTVIKESSSLVAHNLNAYMLFYEREVEQRENGTQNTSREYYTTPAAEAKNPSDVSPSNTDTYAAAVKRGSPFSTTSAVKPKPEIDSPTPKNNKAIPVHLRSTDKSHAKTVFPPAETWSSKSNYSKLPRTSKDGVPSFIPTPIRTASKISHSSLGNSTPVKLPTTDKR
jgi:hypothetical protein